MLLESLTHASSSYTPVSSNVDKVTSLHSFIQVLLMDAQLWKFDDFQHVGPAPVPRLCAHPHLILISEKEHQIFAFLPEK